MYIAQQIMTTPDRTPKERRLMAELHNVGPIDWKGDTLVCRFADGSSLMVVLDINLLPLEFLEMVPSEHEEALQHATACLQACGGWGPETLSHNIESNFPDLDLDECDDIALAALGAMQNTVRH